MSAHDAIPAVLCAMAVASGVMAVGSRRRDRSWRILGLCTVLLGAVVLLALPGVLGALWVVFGVAVVASSCLVGNAESSTSRGPAGMASLPAAALAAVVAAGLIGVGSGPGRVSMSGASRPDIGLYGPVVLAMGLAYLAAAILASRPGGRS